MGAACMNTLHVKKFVVSARLVLLLYVDYAIREFLMAIAHSLTHYLPHYYNHSTTTCMLWTAMQWLAWLISIPVIHPITMYFEYHIMILQA